MLTDPFLTQLWLWSLQRAPIAAIMIVIDTLPSRYGPRVRA